MYDIVCTYVISCVYRIVTYVRDPDQIRGSHFLSFLQYSAALACCLLCAYYTALSVQTANQVGVCSVGPSSIARSGVWSGLLAPLTTATTGNIVASIKATGVRHSGVGRSAEVLRV